MHGVIGFDPHLGRIALPALSTSRSYRGSPIRRRDMREVGIVVASQRRPRVLDYIEQSGLLIPIIDGFETIWASITHNERVDAGAALQAQQLFGGGSSPAAPSATAYLKVIAIANATLTKAKGNRSLGTTTADATTNEFTTIGLSRAAADTPVGGDYTAPSTNGGTFTQNVRKTFTASGSGTAYGAGLLTSTTVAGSILGMEDNFASTAVLVSGDTLTVTFGITN